MPKRDKDTRDSVRHAQLVYDVARIIVQLLEKRVEEQEGTFSKPTRRQATPTLMRDAQSFWEAGYCGPDCRITRRYDPDVIPKRHFPQFFFEALDLLEEAQSVELVYDWNGFGIIEAVRLPIKRSRRRAQSRWRRIHFAIRAEGDPATLDRYELALSRLLAGENLESELREVERLLAEGDIEILDILPRADAFRNIRK